jgi:hypothetical protein
MFIDILLVIYYTMIENNSLLTSNIIIDLATNKSLLMIERDNNT